MKKLILLAALLFSVTPAWSATGIRVVVPAHDIGRGDTISASDLVYQTVADGGFMPGMVTAPEALEGKMARRVLRAGEPLRSEDVRAPVLVTKGQTVTMTFDAPGVTLTAIGRAMSEGGLGETVTVQNPASYRMVSAVVTGLGTVRAAGGVISAPLQSMRARNLTARN